jgi:DMSO/TMAO reductase YedYZ molybdopterin-dependent catalytic subunit
MPSWSRTFTAARAGAGSASAGAECGSGPLLALAAAAGAAGYVTVGSGEYTAVLTREQAEDERVLLALEHEGAPSPRRAGFPRLVGPSEWDCFLSVKSVDRIRVTRQPQRATAATIALGRLER